MSGAVRCGLRSRAIKGLMGALCEFDRNMEKYEMMARESKSAHEKNDLDQQKLIEVRFADS